MVTLEEVIDLHAPELYRRKDIFEYPLPHLEEQELVVFHGLEDIEPFNERLSNHLERDFGDEGYRFAYALDEVIKNYLVHAHASDPSKAITVRSWKGKDGEGNDVMLYAVSGQGEGFDPTVAYHTCPKDKTYETHLRGYPLIMEFCHYVADRRDGKTTFLGKKLKANV